MGIRKISHIGIAVAQLEPQMRLYRDQLGMELVAEEEVADQQVRVAMFRVGQSTIELLCPTSEDSPVAKFLRKRGEGIHHVAYEVEDLEQQLAQLSAQGARLIDKKPRVGAHGMRIAFVHPKSTFGVLTELCQPAPADSDSDSSRP